MSDEQTTFLLLAVLYLVECCLIAGRNSLLFLPRPFGRFWQAQAAGKGLAVRHGVLAVLPPLTPRRPAVLSSPAPCCSILPESFTVRRAGKYGGRR